MSFPTCTLLIWVMMYYFTGDEYRDVDADMYSDTSSMTGVSAVSSSHSRSTGSVVSTLMIHNNLLPKSLTEITS